MTYELKPLSQGGERILREKLGVRLTEFRAKDGTLLGFYVAYYGGGARGFTARTFRASSLWFGTNKLDRAYALANKCFDRMVEFANKRKGER